MLDVYIIDRIRQRQERQQEDSRLPLRIERPVDVEPQRTEEQPREQRGVVEIDFSI